MDKIKLICNNLEKKFINKTIFTNLSFELTNKSSLAITGKNGTGKSTLIKILANFIKETKGKYSLSINDKEIPREKFYTQLGLMAPYLMLYDELTGYENLEFFYGLMGSKNGDAKDRIKYLLEKVNLYHRRNDLVKNYSTGMKQRLKLAFANLKNPLILLLDEPRTYLDTEGIDAVYKIAEQQKENGILIIATNESEDTNLCEEKINIEDFKKK
jgi:heme exporter protein A